MMTQNTDKNRKQIQYFCMDDLVPEDHLLRKKSVRLIAINDNVYTLKGEDDFATFRNIMNEWYARDTSKKIKSVFSLLKSP